MHGNCGGVRHGREGETVGARQTGNKSLQLINIPPASCHTTLAHSVWRKRPSKCCLKINLWPCVPGLPNGMWNTHRGATHSNAARLAHTWSKNGDGGGKCHNLWCAVPSHNLVVFLAKKLAIVGSSRCLKVFLNQIANYTFELTHESRKTVPLNH